MLTTWLMQALLDAVLSAISRKGAKMYRSDGDIIMPTLCEKVRCVQRTSSRPCMRTAAFADVFFFYFRKACANPPTAVCALCRVVTSVTRRATKCLLYWTRAQCC